MPQNTQVIGSEPAPYQLPSNVQQNINLSYAAAKKRKRRDIGGIYGGQQSALERLAARKGMAGSGAEMRGAFNLALQQMGQETEEIRRLDYERMDEERKWAQQERAADLELEKMGAGYGFQAKLQKQKGDLDMALQEGRLTHEQYQNELDRLLKEGMQETQIEQDKWMQGKVEELTRAGWSHDDAMAEADRVWKSGEAGLGREHEAGMQQAGFDQQTFMQKKVAELTEAGWDAEAARQQAALDWEHEKMYGVDTGGPGGILGGDGFGGGTYGLAQQQMQLERDKMEMTRELTEAGWDRDAIAAELDRVFQSEMQESGFTQQEEMAQINADLLQDLEAFKMNQGQIIGAMQNYSDWLTLRIQGEIEPERFNQAVDKLNIQLAELYGYDDVQAMLDDGQGLELWEEGKYTQPGDIGVVRPRT